MLDYFKKIAIINRADDELLYEFVLNEMESGVLIKGLWGKALANSGGDDINAKSIYMQYRVQSIKDALIAQKIKYKELTKPNLFQYIQDKILPSSNDYINLSRDFSKVQALDYKVSDAEESIYDEVAKELANNIRKEGLWLKAIENTDGDEKKALSLYIKYRSESIKEGIAEELATEQKRAKELAIQKKHEEDKATEKRNEEARAGKLEEFLIENNLKIVNIIQEDIIYIRHKSWFDNMLSNKRYAHYENANWHLELSLY